MTRGSPTGLTNSVREIVRRVFGGGREFALSAVLDISDVESIRFPAYKNQAARDGAIRRMLQDERRHCGLVFVPGRHRGVYRYPEIVLDSFRAPGVNSIMSYEAVVESLRAVAQCGRGGRKHVFAILEREGGVLALKQLDPAHYDRVGLAARKFLVGWGVEHPEGVEVSGKWSGVRRKKAPPKLHRERMPRNPVIASGEVLQPHNPRTRKLWNEGYGAALANQSAAFCPHTRAGDKRYWLAGHTWGGGK